MMIFQTKRLSVRKAVTSDVEMYLTLWNSSEVMRDVGFPKGLQITSERICKQIENHNETEFDQTLVVIEKESEKKIGECKIGLPNEKGISCPDFKFLPEYWGNGFGNEIISGLCKYTFSKTRAQIIETSPNVNNVASQKMGKTAGGREIRRFVYHFPTEMQHYTKDLHGIIYHICKKDWLEQNMRIKKITKRKEKSRICKQIIEALPNWFGLESANIEYIENSADTEFYVAYMFEKEVGFFSITSHFPQTSEIYVCGILPDFHRLGIGRKLLRAVEDNLQKKKKKFLTVKTLSSSHPDKGYSKTREFYKACGFHPVEEFKELWSIEHPCLFLVKAL